MSRMLNLVEREARILIVTLLTLAVTCVSLFFFFDDAEEDSLGAVPVAEREGSRNDAEREQRSEDEGNRRHEGGGGPEAEAR